MKTCELVAVFAILSFSISACSTFNKKEDTRKVASAADGGEVGNTSINTYNMCSVTVSVNEIGFGTDPNSLFLGIGEQQKTQAQISGIIKSGGLRNKRNIDLLMLAYFHHKPVNLDFSGKTLCPDGVSKVTLNSVTKIYQGEDFFTAITGVSAFEGR